MLGVMNMIWMAVLTIFIIVEKVVWPQNVWVGRIVGTALVVWGIVAHGEYDDASRLNKQISLGKLKF